jgi:Type I restriction enzyme R protein N terminus (HSDR_N)/PQQ-like domain
VSSSLERLRSVALRSEDDVREEFLTPLLRLLGYDHARGEIERGRYLDTPYKSGTKDQAQIVPDYLTFVDGNYYLAIDAKAPANSGDGSAVVTDREHVGQVHSYASHRVVRAPYFVISNGQSTAVYESNSDSYQPVLLVTQDDIEERIGRLRELISKERLSRQLSERLPLRWERPAATSVPTGFQPMNIDVGDIDHNGLPEVVVALSENYVSAVSERGEVVWERHTDGWAWWLRCTNTSRAGRATVVVLQHNRGPNATGGRIWGLGRDPGDEWVVDIERAGSGFERLDRIAIDEISESAIVGIPGEDRLLAIDLRDGRVRWEAARLAGAEWGATMHVLLEPTARSILATASSQSHGVVARVSLADGVVLGTVALPFRGGQIVTLGEGRAVVVSACDYAALAVLDMKSYQLLHVIEVPGGRDVPLALAPSRDVLVLGDIGRIAALDVETLARGRPEERWVTEDVPGLPSRIHWSEVEGEEALFVGTVGAAALPERNGLYVLSDRGEVTSRHLLSTSQHGGGPINPAGIRDMRVVDLDGDGRPEVIAVADDARLYLWKL